MARRPVKIKDVAELAKVSTATVSRAFNLPHMVNADLREKIFKAADELGYYSNAAAKALRQRRTRIIATILPKLDNTIYAETANAIQQTLYENGYVGILDTSGFDNSRISDRAKYLIEKGAEGILVFGRIDDPALIRHINKFKIPVICIYSYLAEESPPSIGIDNYSAATKIANHIYDLGHRKVLMISGPTVGNDRQQDRVRAFEDVSAEHGAEPIVRTIKQDYVISDAVDVFKKVYQQRDDVTACICNSDFIALGVLLACREMNIDVPGQLAVTGFDDISFATLLTPPLTTVSVPVADIGRRATQALIDFLEKGQAIVSEEVESQLIMRESTNRHIDQSS
ncbi:LacI family DNA-binding transcriptional regulator [Halomonas sp. V046]|uniref:LacI family DNA-binding transcriptional regulator n=1 Tax=Halomonas sp. V046 TaxID=3459611 RepID=UPI004044CD7F